MTAVTLENGFVTAPFDLKNNFLSKQASMFSESLKSSLCLLLLLTATSLMGTVTYEQRMVTHAVKIYDQQRAGSSFEGGKKPLHL